jgi:transposase
MSRWVSQYRHDGSAGLKKAGRAGRKPELDQQNRERLYALLLEGPEQLGYETDLWTCPRVAHLIEREFGVSYHPGHVWKLLIALGWSPQPSSGRTRERNVTEPKNWRHNVWPAITSEPAPKAPSPSSSTGAD